MTQLSSLKEVLVQRIAEQGPMSVADYMALALTHPEFGYYVRQQAFGAEGDFVTAPEISQTFGEMVGLWAASVWMSMGEPSKFLLVELGPGRGTLMADALRLLSPAVPGFVEAAELHLVEASRRLRGLQKEVLSPYSQSVVWHDTVDTLPEGPTLLIANEFLDALPIRQFVKSHDGWHERLVGEGIAGPEVLGFQLQEEVATLPELTAFERARPEAIAELRAEASDLVNTLARRFCLTPGAALFIDYGHEKSAAGDTFQAVRQHKPVHVLQYPGDADLTAHVDFEALTRDLQNVQVLPLQTQEHFLRQLGIEARLGQLLQGASDTQREELISGVTRLVDPAQMGSLFKVLCFTSEGLALPPGFERPAPE